ncbi:hypothetical protein [uncultured Xanthomonas sp.]|uniref:hypothetical protein n=1 Tax=uncultured Xanthomonas sp. TaxID=152831 RepID=UPI0025F33178|nr:hypothetical protein [uncultured Xanthomonas sp.]
MELTVEDLRRESYRTPVARLHFDILMWKFSPPTYEDWAEVVESALHFEIGLITSRRHDFHDLDEDALSAVLNISLQNLNLEASAKFVNGNTDITIEYNSYKWIGEAKFGNDVSKIYKGYLQLTTRYATGITGQTKGGMLIYCSHGSARTALAGWQAALSEQVPNCNAMQGKVDLTFTSEDICEATGATLQIIHIAVPLYHGPMEAQKKLSAKAINAAREARKNVANSEDDATADNDEDQ